ncbi:MAG TPA: ubiquinol-cytochrome c reductase iron-sulfur subunit, partial [Abditibacteriaceae bacterium]
MEKQNKAPRPEDKAVVSGAGTGTADGNIEDAGTAEMTRREFLRTASGASAGVMCAGGLLWLSGCGSDSAKEGASAPVDLSAIPEGQWKTIPAAKTPDGYVIPGAAKLATGAAVMFLAGAEKPIVVFAGENGALQAMSAKCTHAGCVVEWRGTKTRERLHCPCHSSQFDINGKVLGGPAEKPLPKFPLKMQGDDAV